MEREFEKIYSAIEKENIEKRVAVEIFEEEKAKKTKEEIEKKYKNFKAPKKKFALGHQKAVEAGDLTKDEELEVKSKEKRFQKRIEDFVCEKCGKEVKGKGYTDHCPECLQSKHVDINPGDRKSECSGLMEPIGAEVKSDKYIIHYRCVKCGFEHRVKSALDDNFDEIIKIINQPLKK